MAIKRIPNLSPVSRLLLLSLSLASTGAWASATQISVGAGTVAQAAYRLGQQTGVSIAIRDPLAARRMVPALRGKMMPAQAVGRLAGMAQLRLRTVGPRSFILEGRKPQTPKVARLSPVRAKPVVQDHRRELDGTLADVVVTASKQETPLRRFAGQWTVLAGKDLKGWGPSGSEAIEARSVGFSSTHLGAGRNKLFIRGIGDSSFSGPTQSPVGQYVGDVRTGYSGPDPDLQLIDMHSVEVLEGPQGTLYGAGSLGGIVLLRPRVPEPEVLAGELSMGLTATQHGAPGFDISGVVNAPIGGEAAVRAVAYRVVEGGYIDNLATGKKDANRVETSGLRAALAIPLGADWKIEVGALGQQIRGRDSQYADAEGPPLSRDSAVALNFGSYFQLASFAIDKSAGSIRARSTIGATWQRVRENFDASLADQPRQLAQASRASSANMETRVWRPMNGGYSWLLGFSALAHRSEVGRHLASASGEVDLSGVENRVRETTVYGEVGAKIGQGIVATAGGRVTSSTLSGRGHHLSSFGAEDRLGSGAERSEVRFLPSASLLVSPSRNLKVYARYQEGFRPGGLSLGDNFVRRFRNDHLATIETGFRFRDGIDRGFSLRGSVTHSDWRNIQADFIDGNGLPSTANIGNGRVWTAALNASARLTPAARIDAGFAWNEGKVVEPSVAYAALARTGHIEVPNISRIVARVGANWTQEVSDQLSFKGDAYIRYVGRSRLGIGPKLGESQGDYLDSGISLRLGNSRRAVSLSATNLTDEVGNRFALGTPVAVEHDQITPLRPRTVRLGFEAAF
jgi:outer membrane receptor protein involved in Fe transport